MLNHADRVHMESDEVVFDNDFNTGDRVNITKIMITLDFHGTLRLPMINETRDNEAQVEEQKTVPRTLPRETISSDVQATPKVDYKDRIWTDIDTLDDVKRMATEGPVSVGFPENFEEDITRLRQMHAALLQTSTINSTDTDVNLQEQQEQVDEIVSTIEKYIPMD
ncbi:hypothetical protein C6P43_001024 [Kluyveromyces marxianus]|nr:hypothetical protein C6P43_001024 [Kluyveromyces marxianus]